ncbi:hypothetical protein [Actinoplanes sp. NPDC026619]|uniref:SWIM zinc finger family protein n=1 Tax=Actinoplanes sp. NPDC026619 TaxID=3155798 RepID=UPI00340B851F
MTDSMAVAFLGTFESLRMGPTFARGRRDQRAGHVRQLTISGSLVVALVRGPDDPTAFRARIAMRSFGASEWARVEQDLVAEARYTADLLAGRMPPGIGAVFAAAGLSLVPLSLDEVAMDCSCERWPMPCVHLAATCYALARSFEEDPFGIFAWRGRSRDELLLHLRELRAAFAQKSIAPESEGYSSANSEISSGDLGNPVDFWGGQELSLAPTGGRPGAVTRPDALLDQLDPPHLAHDGRPIVDLLRPAYLALPEA